MPPKNWRKKKDAAPHIGKLMIVLRNRHVVWIDMGPEDGPALRAKITAAMNAPLAAGAELPTDFNLTGDLPMIDMPASIDLAPFSEDTIRVEDIVHVRYIGPKSAGTAPEATP